MMKVEFYHPCFEYSENLKEIVYLPTTKEVCPSCNGEGMHERRDIDCSLLVDSMHEDGDVEGLESYFSGSYDVLCTECGGKNVIDVQDMEYFANNYPELYKEVCEWEDEKIADAKCSAQERAMGA